MYFFSLETSLLTRSKINGSGNKTRDIKPSVLDAHPIPRVCSMRGAARGRAPPNELRKKVLPAKTLATCLGYDSPR